LAQEVDQDETIKLIILADLSTTAQRRRRPTAGRANRLEERHIAMDERTATCFYCLGFSGTAPGRAALGRGET
jgi:hypothetical protein